MAINYSTVITKEELELINEEKYNEIKLICEAMVKRQEDRAYNLTYLNDNKQSKAYEAAFRKDEFANAPYCEKILIASNLLYYNNTNIINILLSKNITYKILTTIVNKLSLIKALAIKKDEFELDEHTTISDKNLNIICRLIRKYYGYDDYNLIIAKLVEIVVFNKELYLSLEGGHCKTYGKPSVKK